MYLIKEVTGWSIQSEEAYTFFANKLFVQYPDTWQEKLSIRTRHIAPDEIVYIVEGQKIQAYSIAGKMTGLEIIALGFDTFKGYKLEPKEGAMFMIRKLKRETV